MSTSVAFPNDEKGDAENRRAVGPMLINAAELAKILCLSERTLYRLKSAGQLPSPIYLGGSVRWRHAEILAWVADGCPTPATDNACSREKDSA